MFSQEFQSLYHKRITEAKIVEESKYSNHDDKYLPKLIFSVVRNFLNYMRS